MVGRVPPVRGVERARREADSLAREIEQIASVAEQNAATSHQVSAVVEEQTYSEHFACSNTTHPPYSVGEIEPRNGAAKARARAAERYG